MVSLTVKVDGDGAWPDLITRPPIRALRLEIAGLKGGMVSGKPSVMLRVDLPDGNAAIVETSLALFLTAADALRARHGDPR